MSRVDIPHLRMMVYSAFAALLLWQVVSQSLAAYLASVAPQAALWLHPQQPAALVTLADRAFNATPQTAVSDTSAADQLPQPKRTGAASQGPTGITDSQNLNHAFSAFEIVGQNQSVNRPIAPDNSPAVRMWAEEAVLNDPLNPGALRILGRLAEADGDDASAAKFMSAAAHQSLHASGPIYWLLRKNAQAGDDQAAVYFADVLLRTNPEMGSYVVPILAHLAEEKKSNGVVKAALASNPPWRGQFFEALPNDVTDPHTPLDLLVALRTTPAPPTTREVGFYIDMLVAHKLYSLAYYTWLQFLPPEELRRVGLLFNGNFDVAPSGVPFDWQIASGAGVTIDIVPAPEKSGKRALLIDFQYGRVEYHSVAELVMLGPGTYRFDGEYKGQLAGPRGLKWRIVCAGNGIPILGESPMITGAAPAWRDVTFTFTVPATGCPAQFVRLDLDARMPSEQLVSGSMFFDGLLISRVLKPPV